MAHINTEFELLHGVDFPAIFKQLKDLQKEVVVVLRNGMTYSGTIDEIKSGRFLWLRQLKGKALFDAVILFDDISAVEYRNG